MREIDAASLAFQQQLNTLWEEYRLLYDRVSDAGAVSVAGSVHLFESGCRSVQLVLCGVACSQRFVVPWLPDGLCLEWNWHGVGLAV